MIDNARGARASTLVGQVDLNSAKGGIWLLSSRWSFFSVSEAAFAAASTSTHLEEEPRVTQSTPAETPVNRLRARCVARNSQGLLVLLGLAGAEQGRRLEGEIDGGGSARFAARRTHCEPSFGIHWPEWS